MEQKFKQDKGVAGLTIMLSIIVMLFVIGLIVMIFSIMGAKLETSTYDTTTGSIANETVTGLTNVSGAGDYLSVSTLRDVTCSLTAVINATSNATVPASNYTTVNCLIYATNGSAYTGQNVKVSYSYTYEADNTATDVMNDTVHSVASSTDWFDIFIVIGAMVVLILLTVIIITAIRSSGMVDGAGSQQNNVGTA
jgi:uncharacterized membrane protein